MNCGFEAMWLIPPKSLVKSFARAAVILLSYQIRIVLGTERIYVRQWIAYFPDKMLHSYGESPRKKNVFQLLPLWTITMSSWMGWRHTGHLFDWSLSCFAHSLHKHWKCKPRFNLRANRDTCTERKVGTNNNRTKYHPNSSYNLLVKHSWVILFLLSHRFSFLHLISFHHQ